MRKNSFGQGLAIFFVIIGVLFVIGSIGEASEPKYYKNRLAKLPTYSVKIEVIIIAKQATAQHS